MVFTSTVFLFLFLPIVFGIYYCPLFKNSRKFKNLFLLSASLIFYAWGEPRVVLLMILSIIVTWILGLFMGNDKYRKLYLVIGMIYHIGILFIFKYLTFLTEELNRISGKDYFNVNITLPIGISFFTFQMMSYLFDVYYGRAEVQKNVFFLGLYVSFFPQLIAGPIVRYESIEKEIYNRKETRTDFEKGIKRFVIGLGKKALIADFLALIADNIFIQTKFGDISVLTAWIGAVAYTLEIYYDFSGYSDMAIGLGQCFGFHFNENFNYPYIADSITNFWKRWHISLTDWFRDYVYSPIAFKRTRKRGKLSKREHMLITLLVWTLTGIWHGANWTFLLWGIYFFVLQIAEKFFYKTKKWPSIVRHTYTIILIILSFVIFKSDSIVDAFKYCGYMFGRGGLIDSAGITYLENGLITIIVGVIFCLPIEKIIKERFKSVMGMLLIEVVSYIFLAGALIITVVLSISGGYSPFIYFNF